jgi:steroid delta-isomerase-like uncharacterized protein
MSQNQAERPGDGIEVMRRFYELMDTHQFDDLESVLAEDLVFRMGPNTLDRPALIEMIRDAYQAFPDFTHQIEEAFSQGDRVVVRGTNTATHLGDFNGMEGTGRRIEFGQIAIVRVADGKIRDAWEYGDVLTFQAQLNGEAEP